MRRRSQQQVAAEQHQQHRSPTHGPSREISRKPEVIRIRVLGGFEVTVGARTIEEGAWRLRKAASLVKLLALAPGHRLHREQIIDALWPNWA